MSVSRYHVRRMFWLAAAAAVITCFYHLIAAIASLRQWLRPAIALPTSAPGLSILKPVRGLDPGFADAVRSHAAQDYPGPLEILFGVADPEDPAIAVVEAVAREFPARAIRVIRSTAVAPNAKVAVLMDLAREAQYPLLLVNDSDITVPAGYLREVTAPLADEGIGLVTCLYRAQGATLAARWEALGIAVDFMPSVLVAPLVGIKEFGLGATLVFRRSDLEAIGGFAAIGPYLADDYWLAKKITTGLRKPAYLSRAIVDTALGDDSWSGVWKHQVRWARTIRVSRGDGYLGLPVTHAGLWAILAAAIGAWPWAAAIVVMRWFSAFTGGVLAMDHALARRWFWLAPAWDVWAFVIWWAGLAGRTVEWRGRRLRLRAGGRLD